MDVRSRSIIGHSFYIKNKHKPSKLLIIGFTHFVTKILQLAKKLIYSPLRVRIKHNHRPKKAIFGKLNHSSTYYEQLMADTDYRSDISVSCSVIRQWFSKQIFD